MLWEIWKDEELHIEAAKGLKSVGLSVDIDGGEDHLIIKEAADFWHMPTTDRKHASIRHTLNGDVDYMCGCGWWLWLVVGSRGKR